MSDGKQYWTTREAANYLGLSTVAMLSKVGLLDAHRVGRGYRWPVEQVKGYARAVAGKALNDPTRNRVLERP